MIENLNEVFIVLLMCHFIGDFVLQSDRMAVEKCPGKDSTLNWSWWLTGHASTHALLVYLVTWNIAACVSEFFCHFAIDFMKCRYKFRLSSDQLLHIICKMIWVYIII